MYYDLITIIGGIIILAVLLVTTYFVIRKKNLNNAKAAKEFLEGLGDELIKIILRTTKEIDPSEIDSAEEFEVIVLNAVYNNTWDYVVEQIQKNLEENSILRTIVEIIDKEYMIKFVDTLCEKAGLTEKIQGEYAAYNLRSNDIEAKDQALAIEYADKEKYNSDVTDDDLEPAKEPEYTEEEVAALNPQRDEDEGFDNDDDSMEIIPDEDETNKVIALKDSAGRWRFYKFDEEGKKIRISKDEAIEALKNQGDSEEILAEIL